MDSSRSDDVVGVFVCSFMVIVFSLEYSNHLMPDVLRELQGCLRGVCLKFYGCFNEVSRMCQGSFKDDASKFQGSFKDVSRMFQGRLRSVSMEVSVGF